MKKQRTTAIRWWRFNLVGSMGVGIQLGFLALLEKVGVPFPTATVLAVESAIVHNFAWHERYTWQDRPVSDAKARLKRLLRLNFTNGAVSLIGNLVITTALVALARIPVLAANFVAILCCSTLNFWLGDRYVFTESSGR